MLWLSVYIRTKRELSCCLDFKGVAGEIAEDRVTVKIRVEIFVSREVKYWLCRTLNSIKDCRCYSSLNFFPLHQLQNPLSNLFLAGLWLAYMPSWQCHHLYFLLGKYPPTKHTLHTHFHIKILDTLVQFQICKAYASMHAEHIHLTHCNIYEHASWVEAHANL